MGLVIGSSSAIFACGMARLGLKVGIIGIVGDNHFGHFMLRALWGRNVDISAVQISKTWSTGISVILSLWSNRNQIKNLSWSHVCADGQRYQWVIAVQNQASACCQLFLTNEPSTWTSRSFPQMQRIECQHLFGYELGPGGTLGWGLTICFL